MSPRLIKKEKGIALILTIVVLIALSTMSIALLSIIQTSAKNTARSHRTMVANQAAEYGIEAARIDLIQDLVQTTEVLINDKFLRRSDLSTFTTNCLALHGYTEDPIVAHTLPDGTEVPDSKHRIYYTIGSNSVRKWNVPDDGAAPFINDGYDIFADSGMSFSPQIGGTSTDELFEDYEYIYLTQRVPVDTALGNYNIITQKTYDEDLSAAAETWDTGRQFYRVISCGFSPGKEYVVPLQGYYSTGGRPDEEYFVGNNLIFTGYYRP